MNDTTKAQLLIKLTEEMLESEIKALVVYIDNYLNRYSQGIAFIPKPLLSVFEQHSKLEVKGRYKKSTSKYAYLVSRPKIPQSMYEYLSSFKERPLIHSLFVAVAYHNYDYHSHTFINVLPKVVHSSIFNLALWGVNHMNMNKTNIRPLSAINSVFSLVTQGNQIDYLKHVCNQYHPDLNETTIKKVSSIKTDTGLNVTFILSETHCVALIGDKGFVANVADETELCIGDIELLLTPEGVAVQENKYIGVSLSSFNFVDETKRALATIPHTRNRTK